MLTRRELLKGGGAAVVGGLAVASLGASAGAASIGDVKADVGTSAAPDGQFRRGGPGPLYWSTYGYNNAMNAAIPEPIWKANVDWVAETFRSYGYDMVCTDGWVDTTQKVSSHGYIRSLSDSWTHDWAWWATYVATRGLKLGFYYNPLWATKSAVMDSSVTVVGRPDVKVADIVNAGDYLNSDGDLYWVDVTRDGAEEYVKGYVDYFRQLGAVFLRIDFLGWYEAGFDQNDGTIGVAHGRDNYLQALSWMRQAAGDMQLSLVLPNLFDHGSAERQFGDLIRIDNDVSFGGWYNLSEGPQGWQPIWSQWSSPFLGFTGFSDLSGRGQLILDGDPIIISSFQSDDERQSVINLFTMAGAAIAITDRYDTIGPNAPFFQNPEVLAVHQAGLVGKPVYHNSHGFEYDTSSRDPERWIGQLADGSWVVGLFNRSNEPGPATKEIDFNSELGLSAPASVRDLWAHQDLGLLTTWSVPLQPHTSSLIKVTPHGVPRYQAEVGAWLGTARFDNTFSGYAGLGYLTGLDTPGSSVTLAMAASKAGRYTLSCHVANATGKESTLTVVSSDPRNGQRNGSARLKVPSSIHWTTWRTVSVTIDLGSGDNVVALTYGDDDRGSVHLDYVTLT
jgi:glucan 1,6-alpha-isomaltosidase